MIFSEYSNIIPLGISDVCKNVASSFKRECNYVSSPFCEFDIDIQYTYRVLLEKHSENLNIRKFFAKNFTRKKGVNIKNITENFEKVFFTEKNLLLYSDLKFVMLEEYKTLNYKENQECLSKFHSELVFLQEILKLNAKNEIIFFSNVVNHFRSNIIELPANLNLVNVNVDDDIQTFVRDSLYAENYKSGLFSYKPKEKEEIEQTFMKNVVKKSVRAISNFLSFNYK